MDAFFDLLRGILPPGTGDAVGVFVSAVLTFMVFTYIFGDNLFFHIAQHILIGAVAAYAVVAAVHQVLLGQLLTPLLTSAGAEWHLLAPLMLGIGLLAKATPRTAWLGNVSIGFMLGVGAALGIGGALLGTLLPQLQATSLSLFEGIGAEMPPGAQLGQFIGNVIVVVGTLGALLSFQFVRGGDTLAGRAFNGMVSIAGVVGQVFIWIAFGALFAGLALSRITLLVSRVQFLLEAFKLSVR